MAIIIDKAIMVDMASMLRMSRRRRRRRRRRYSERPASATDGQPSVSDYCAEASASEKDENAVDTNDHGIPLIFKQILFREVFLMHALHKYVYMYIPRAHVHVRS